MTNESQDNRLRPAKTSFWVWVALLLGLVVTAGPFLWMVSTSFKLPANQFDGSFFPYPATLDNYTRLFTSAPYLLAEIYNSLEVSVLSTIGQVLTCAMAGFAFSVFQFRGRNFLFALLLLTLTIPPQVTLIPNFIIFSHLGLIGTKIPLWIVSFLGGAFGTFLLRQYFASIPFELAEAARMDGASLIHIFLRVYFPLSKPALSALAILTFTGAWNENGTFRFTREVGATVEVGFEGTALRLIAQRFDDGGRAELRLDGKVVDTLDLYGPGRGLPFEWRRSGLAPGKHGLSLSVTGEKAAESKDHYINIVGLDISE